MEEIVKILEELDWSPLFISLKTGIAATFISFFSGDICGAQGGKGVAAEEGGHRRNPDAADGPAADSGGLFPAAFVQQEKAVWVIPV